MPFQTGEAGVSKLSELTFDPIADNATKVENATLDEAVRYYNFLSAGGLARIFNHDNLTAEKAASILDDANISFAKAYDIFMHRNLLSPKMGEIFHHSNLSDARASAICDEGGLTAYWPFQEGSGDTLYDDSEHGHDGTINGPTWNSYPTFDKPGLYFDQTDDYVDQPLNMNSSAQNVTVLACVRTDTTGTVQEILASYDGTYAFEFRINSDDTWCFSTYDGTRYGIGSAGSPSTDVWYFLGGKFHTSNGYTLWVYDNDADTWTEHTSADTSFATNDLKEFLGAQNNSGSPRYYFGGDIHWISAYKGTALSDNEIKTVGNKIMS